MRSLHYIFLVISHTLLVHTKSNAVDALFHSNDIEKVTKSIEEMVEDYEDDKNSMLAKEDNENINIYQDLYEELDSRNEMEKSMNIIFFGPPISFMRLDPETILHIFTHTIKHLIPISRVILAWNILTDGKTAAFLHGREFSAFGNLLNDVPEEDLYYVNFGDPSVLKYFSSYNLNLHIGKYGILVAAYRRFYGNSWYSNSTQINELGYLLCGFPSLDLGKISPETFKGLNVYLLSKIDKCSHSQKETLYTIAIHPNAYGKPYMWSLYEIRRLNGLLTHIPESDISSIQLEAMPAITEKVIKSMHQRKLKYFTKEQIIRLNPKARRAYILRMELRNSLDMSQITERNGFQQCSYNYVLGPYFSIVALILDLCLN